MNTKIAKTVFVLAALLLIGACKKGAQSYYPLQPGISWQYQSVAKAPDRSQTGEVTRTNLPARSLNGKLVVPQKSDIDGSTEFSFVVSDASGIYEVAQQSPEDAEPKPLVPPNYLIRLPIQAGASWDENDKAGSDGGFMEAVPVAVKCTIETLDDGVTVPLGTFRAMKISCRGSGQKTMKMQGRTHATIESHAWFAPGVGLVRFLHNEDIGHPAILGKGTDTLYSLHLALELVSFKQ